MASTLHRSSSRSMSKDCPTVFRPWHRTGPQHPDTDLSPVSAGGELHTNKVFQVGSQVHTAEGPFSGLVETRGVRSRWTPRPARSGWTRHSRRARRRRDPRFGVGPRLLRGRKVRRVVVERTWDLGGTGTTRKEPLTGQEIVLRKENSFLENSDLPFSMRRS